MVQICGRGLSVLGRGKVGAAVGDPAGFAVWVEATIAWQLADWVSHA